ncbi:MAG: hypothetical protein Q9183_006553 [Haloplaca sp. 2 TL-2023]
MENAAPKPTPRRTMAEVLDNWEKQRARTALDPAHADFVPQTRASQLRYHWCHSVDTREMTTETTPPTTTTETGLQASLSTKTPQKNTPKAATKKKSSAMIQKLKPEKPAQIMRPPGSKPPHPGPSRPQGKEDIAQPSQAVKATSNAVSKPAPTTQPTSKPKHSNTQIPTGKKSNGFETFMASLPTKGKKPVETRETPFALMVRGLEEREAKKSQEEGKGKGEIC